MSTKRSDEYALLWSHLSHEWQDVDGVIFEVGGKIPPGRCIRSYDNRMDAVHSSKPPKQAKAISQERKIFVGARQLLNDCIRNMKMTGEVEIRELNGKRQIRGNRFDASYLDRILHGKTKVLPPPPPTAVPVTTASVERVPVLSPTQVEPFHFMFDGHNVEEHVEVIPDLEYNLVKLTLSNALPQDLICEFDSIAAEWVADRLGMSAITARSGQTVRIRDLENSGSEKRKRLMKPSYLPLTNNLI